ncbi:MAG: S24 family peptidase [Planctomycetota bacterium]|nr:S24 family peptidase [Planctomycetota bacterium]
MTNDRQYLERLRDYYARNRVLPSYSRIGALVELNSKASVAGLVLRLKAAGFVESTPDRRLKPGRRFFERTVTAKVQAGPPTSVSDPVIDTLTIDDHLISNPSKTVLITVNGDSMIDAGIHAGDVVVVEKRISASIGDIVVAIIDGEFTLKRFEREKGRIVLRPANKAHRIVRPKGAMELFGVVIGLFRKYR